MRHRAPARCPRQRLRGGEPGCDGLRAGAGAARSAERGPAPAAGRRRARRLPRERLRGCRPARLSRRRPDTQASLQNRWPGGGARQPPAASRRPGPRPALAGRLLSPLQPRRSVATTGAPAGASHGRYADAVADEDRVLKLASAIVVAMDAAAAVRASRSWSRPSPTGARSATRHPSSRASTRRSPARASPPSKSPRGFARTACASRTWPSTGSPTSTRRATGSWPLLEDELLSAGRTGLAGPADRPRCRDTRQPAGEGVVVIGERSSRSVRSTRPRPAYSRDRRERLSPPACRGRILPEVRKGAARRRRHGRARTPLHPLQAPDGTECLLELSPATFD